MTKRKTGSSPTTLPQNHQSLFDELPPLGSEAYIRLMDDAESAKIPPQVLARAYRQLCQANNEAGMKATLNRLLQKRNLSKIIGSMRNKVPPEQSWFDEDDLLQDTRREIMRVLPTDRGAGAETAWVSFAYQCMIDAWRKSFGRKGARLKMKIGTERVTVTKARAVATDSENGADGGFPDPEDEINPVEALSNEEASAAAFHWHVGLSQDQTELIEKIVKKTIDKIQEPLLRQIAADQFGDDPSPISGGTSDGGKPPLTEQTGLDRHTIARRINTVRRILAGNIRAAKELKVDTDWLKKFIGGSKKTKNKKELQTTK